MEALHQVLFYLGIFIIAASLIPLIRHDFWIYRVFEYPRLQKLCLNAGIILAFVLWIPLKAGADQVLVLLLVLNLGYLMYQIFPFTIFARKQVINSSKASGSNNIKLLIANVFQDNRQSDGYHTLIKQCDPDVILMVETNKWWEEQMDPILESYPHHLKIPLENTYGMLLYSRFELIDGEIKYLVEDDIPSIAVDVKLASGTTVRLYCLHPRPPVPGESQQSTERDKEILLVGQKAKENTIPTIVIGDLNDVAWSYTTELFSKTSGLLDPRKGRGFFNTFHAKYFILRFPLDHVFCSSDFTLTSIQRLHNCGSDHFPMCINLQYDAKAIHKQEEPEANAEEKEIAAEKINAITG